MTITELMLRIKALDPNATLCLSDYTGQWYVSAAIEISDGAVLTGIVEHRDAPADAVAEFVNRLCEIDTHAIQRRLVTRGPDGGRREWRWNGGGFVEIARPREPVTS